MAVPDAAVTHYAVEQAVARRAAEAAADIWRTLSDDLDGSWTGDRVGERLFVTTSAMQLTAAAPADRYLDAVLDEQDIDPTRTARIRPRALAGVASDGRPLETLLYLPVITTKKALREGATRPEALARGQAQLMQLVASQVQDAGRVATSVGMAARPAVTGWVRMLVPPSCSRCTILAGRVYRWNRGFQRHPMCDCRHIPTADSVAGDVTTDPRSYFDTLDEAQQDRIFTKAGAQAIRDGADLNQVVNARRGMSTTVGPGGRRSLAARRSGGRQLYTTTTAGRMRGLGEPRLMPEQIYADAVDRADAVRLLRRHGYLI